MEYWKIAGVDRPISRLVMGSSLCSTQDLARMCTVFDHFVALGGNALDTAHVYGGGDAERALGMWLRLRDNREQVVLIGKGGHPDEHWAPLVQSPPQRMVFSIITVRRPSREHCSAAAMPATPPPMIATS